jgi:hypothetical protein
LEYGAGEMTFSRGLQPPKNGPEAVFVVRNPLEVLPNPLVSGSCESISSADFNFIIFEAESPTGAETADPTGIVRDAQYSCHSNYLWSLGFHTSSQSQATISA